MLTEKEDERLSHMVSSRSNTGIVCGLQGWAHAGEPAAKPGTDKDFWNRALQTPIDDKQPASGAGTHYPELYRGGAQKSTLQTSHVSGPSPDRLSLRQHSLFGRARHVTVPPPNHALWCWGTTAASSRMPPASILRLWSKSTYIAKGAQAIWPLLLRAICERLWAESRVSFWSSC